MRRIGGCGWMQRACMWRDIGLAARPSREFAPAGDLLSERPESRQRVAPAPSPLAALAVPCDARNPRLAQNSLRYAAFRQPREVSPRSGLRPRLGLLRFSAPLRGVKEQPAANSQTRKPFGGCIWYAPFSAAEERKVLRPCAQRTSRTDSVRLSDRSVAKGVPHGASRLEYRREPLAKLAAVRSGGALCLLSGGPESRSPAGAKSRHGPGLSTTATAKPTQ